MTCGSDIYCTLNLQPKEVVATTNAQEWKKLKKVDPSAKLEYYCNKGPLRGKWCSATKEYEGSYFQYCVIIHALYTMKYPCLCFLVLQRDSKVMFLAQNNWSRWLSPLYCKILSHVLFYNNFKDINWKPQHSTLVFLKWCHMFKSSNYYEDITSKSPPYKQNHYLCEIRR